MSSSRRERVCQIVRELLELLSLLKTFPLRAKSFKLLWCNLGSYLHLKTCVAIVALKSVSMGINSIAGQHPCVSRNVLQRPCSHSDPSWNALRLPQTK